MASQQTNNFTFKEGTEKRAKRIPSKEWDDRKKELHALFHTPGSTLDKIIAKIGTTNLFNPTRGQYRGQFKKWGWKRYKTEKDAASDIDSPASASTLEAPKRKRELVLHSTPLDCDDVYCSGELPPLSELDEKLFDEVEFPPEKRRRLLGVISWVDRSTPEWIECEDAEGEFPTGINVITDRQSDPVNEISNETQLPTISDVHKDQYTEKTFPKDIGETDSLPAEGTYNNRDEGSNSAKVNEESQSRFLEYDENWIKPEKQFTSGAIRDNLPNYTVDSSFDYPDHKLDAGNSTVASLGPSKINQGSFEDSSFEQWINHERGPGIDTSTHQQEQVENPRPIDSFFAEDFQNVKLAADFLSALENHTDGFTLYAQILGLLGNLKHPSWMMSWVKVACARSAAKPSQLKMIEAMTSVASTSAEIHIQPANLEVLFVQAQLALRYEHSGDKNAAKRLTKAALTLEFTDIRFLQELPEDNRSLDLLAYVHLMRNFGYYSFSSENESPAVSLFGGSHLADKILRRQPGPFEIRDGSMTNPCLRSCVKWCDDELQAIISTAGSCPALLAHNKKSDVKKHAAIEIFYCLWERWQRQEMESAVPEHALWATGAEKLMGISGTELLKLVCFSIPICLIPPRKSDDYSKVLLQQASAGATFLAKNPDSALAHIFLNTYRELNTSVSALSGPRVSRMYTRNFVEKKLGVVLPSVNESAANYKTGIQNRPRTPTLAASPRSSELASILSMKNRIQRNTSGQTAATSRSRHSSTTDLALTLVSELSDGVARYLNFSPLLAGPRSISSSSHQTDREMVAKETASTVSGDDTVSARFLDETLVGVGAFHHGSSESWRYLQA